MRHSYGSPRTEPFKVSIVTELDTLHVGFTSRALATVLDSTGNRVKHPVTWRSLQPDRLSVEANGRMTGRLPGVARIEALAGSAADTLQVIVGTAGCTMAGFQVGNDAAVLHEFFLDPGRLRWLSRVRPVKYRETGILWGAGLIYGTNPENVHVGYDYGTSSTDFVGRRCLVTADSIRTVALLGRAAVFSPNAGLRSAPDLIDNLVVVEDVYRFHDPGNDDYILFRYTFTNSGGEPISGLRAGISVDFDLYDGTGNIGMLDPSGVAYARTSDVDIRPVTAGVAVFGANVSSYSLGEPRPTRFDYFSALASNTIASEGRQSDVTQIIGVPPIVLEPGQSWSFSYAVVAGGSYDKFRSHVAAARAKVAALGW